LEKKPPSSLKKGSHTNLTNMKNNFHKNSLNINQKKSSTDLVGFEEGQENGQLVKNRYISNKLISNKNLVLKDFISPEKKVTFNKSLHSNKNGTTINMTQLNINEINNKKISDNSNEYNNTLKTSNFSVEKFSSKANKKNESKLKSNKNIIDGVSEEMEYFKSKNIQFIFRYNILGKKKYFNTRFKRKYYFSYRYKKE